VADKPESEHLVVPVDAIIDAATFDALQAQLKARNPKVCPPSVVTGPILLTGLATCATCGGGMTIRTGKSGRYRYYVCAAAAQKGKDACSGRSVPMDRLDRAVTDRIGEQLLAPERIGDLLRGLMTRQTKREADFATRLNALRAKLSEMESRLGRLYQAIETGIADANDPTLKDRIAAVKAERDIAKAAFDRAVGEMRLEARITAERIASFVAMMRGNVLSGDTAFRRAYLRAVIDKLEVDGAEIRIHGRRTALERLVTGGAVAPAGVPSSVRGWRARRNSNF
jgi:site-specific DNA recombinase